MNFFLPLSQVKKLLYDWLPMKWHRTNYFDRFFWIFENIKFIFNECSLNYYMIPLVKSYQIFRVFFMLVCPAKKKLIPLTSSNLNSNILTLIDRRLCSGRPPSLSLSLIFLSLFVHSHQPSLLGPIDGGGGRLRWGLAVKINDKLRYWIVKTKWEDTLSLHILAFICLAITIFKVFCPKEKPIFKVIHLMI